MCDYTPTTEEVRDRYFEQANWAAYEVQNELAIRRETSAEFDRWLADVKAQAVIELVARIEAAVILLGDDDITPTGRRMISKVLNPYRQGEEQ